ncbi:MAG: cytochrome P450 [Pseudomonadota bacterium]
MTAPAHVPEHLIRSTEPMQAHALDADPFIGTSRAARELPEIFYAAEEDLRGQSGHWVVTTDELIREIIRDAKSFSSSGIAGFSMLLGEQWPLIPLEIDPPLQTEFRRVMAPILAPARVKTLEDDIRGLAVHLIDQIKDDGECDFNRAFGTPLPVVIFMRLMGMPLDRLDTFLAWENDLLHSGDMTKRVEAAKSIYEFLSSLIEARRADPQDDLVSMAVQMEVEGRSLTQDEIMGMCYLFFVGGLDTVAATLGYIFKYLAENPEDRRRLAEDFSLIPNAIEELMRRHSVVSTRRLVTRDMEFHGVQLKAGDYIECDLGLSGTDPEAYDDPLNVDITRKPNPHLGFGGGPHRCFGSNLARAEMRIGIEEWLKRIPDFTVKPGAELRSHLGVKGLDALPIQWRKPV